MLSRPKRSYSTVMVVAAPFGPVWLSGGVALNQAMVAALGEALGRPVRVLAEPQLVGALGAAISVLP